MVDSGSTVEARPASPRFDPRQLGISASAGIVGALLNIGVLFSMVALIFSGPLAPYVGQAVGFALVGTGLMTIIFALFSSRPAMLIYAQDAPALIVALMGANIAAALGAADGSTLFATVLAAVVTTTLATGAAFLLLGRFRLGSLVRYLPYPVVGGFLAGTGWLLVLGSFGVLLGAQPNLADLPGLFAPATLWRWIPGVLFAVVALAVLRRTSHPLTMPALFVGAILLFYAGLVVAGISLDEAQARGMLLGPFPASSGLSSLSPALLGAVNWQVLAGQAGTIGAAVVISVIGLLLNVSGLQLARREEFDLNRELQAAGAAQLATGLLGGLPGYHALGLSVLVHQMGARTRLAGVIAGLLVCGTSFFGVALLSLIPQLVLGGMICYLGLAFLAEWLFDSWFRLPRIDYALILLISLLIAGYGILAGVGVGLLIAVILFVIAYSRVDVVKHALSGATIKSQVTRPYRDQQALREQGEQIVVFQLQGFIFFGTAHDLFERIRSRTSLVSLPALRFVLLDFRLVPGLDSTAMLSFAKLSQLANSQGFTLVIAAVKPTIRRQIERGLEPADAGRLVFVADLDRGLEWCEQQVLAELPDRGPLLSLHEQLARLAPEAAGLETLLAALERRQIAAGDYLIRQGDEPEDMFFVEAGQVTAQIEAPDQPPRRLETMRAGRAVGELGFYLGRRRTAAVVADEPGQVLCVTRQAIRRLAEEQPEAASAFHLVMARLLSERVVHLVDTVDALQR